MKDNNTGLKLSFILGAMIGALAAIFMTPTSGKKLRRDVLKKGKSFINDTKDNLEDLRDEYVDPNIDKMKDSLGETMNFVKDKGQEAKDMLKEKTSEVKSEVNKQLLNFRSRINSKNEEE